MHLQIYLSGATQKHFGISANQIPKDTEIEISPSWWSLWRCEYLASTEDSSQHLFLFTNESTRFSLIVPSEDNDMDGFLNDFQNTMLLYLCEYGAEIPKKGVKINIDIIRGRHNSLISTMNDQITHTMYWLGELGLTINETENHLHKLPSSTLGYATPLDKIVKHLSTNSPLPFTARTHSALPDNILAFPGALAN